MSLYTELKDEYLNDVYDAAGKKLDECKQDLEFIKKPTELGDYARYIQALKMCKGRAAKITLEFDPMVIKQRLNDKYKNIVDEHINREVVINEKYTAMVEEKVASLTNEAVEHNQSVRADFDEQNRVYVELEEKRKVLTQYADEIVNVCAEYGITTTDVDIDNSSFTVEELGGIYDEYIKYLSKTKNHMNVITEFRKRFPDVMTQGGILLGFLLLALTPIRYGIAGAILYLIVRTQLKTEEKLKYFSVLLGLLYNIKPLEMGFQSDIDESKLVSEEVDLDNDEEMKVIEEEWQKELDALDKEDPSLELEKDKAEMTNDYPELLAEIKTLEMDFKNDQVEFITSVSELIEKAQKEFEEKKANVKLLGQEVQESVVFNTKFKLGCQNGVLEEVYDIGLNNIIIKPSSDKVALRKFIQVLFANALCNVRPTNLTAILYDPNNSCQDLISFYTDELQRFIELETDKLEEILKGLKATAEKNLRDMRGQTINEFNMEAERINKTPKDYKLLVVLSQPKKLEEDEALREFMKYSAKLGVFVWVVSNIDVEGVKVFNTPFEGVRNPYDIEEGAFGHMVAETLVKAIETTKSPALMWQDFVSVAIPDKEIWSGDASKDIELFPGFWEGDPTMYKPFTVGNEGNVHMIGVGGTGAGKSVFLNHLICCIARKYHPKEVELWLADFKGVEFKAYLANEERPFMLPHIKACMCTSDGDYATSVFKALRNMSDGRNDDMKAVGVKNLPSWRAKVSTLIGQPKPKALLELHKDEPSYNPIWTEDDIWPRVLFVCDEFQVIFEKADSNNLTSIKADITQLAKVARASGVHIFFTSQSMKKTLSPDILQQFTLRFALRCDKEVSQEILGTSKASDIKERNGYLIVKSLGMSNEEQRKYRTPFLNDSPPKTGGLSEFHQVIKSIYERAVAEGFKFRDVITYEESTTHKVEEIDDVYNNVSGIPDSGMFLLGMRMTYDVNKAPDNIVLTPVNNSHIFSAFSDTEDKVNFYKTIMRNLSNHREKGTVFINSQVSDLHYLCELDTDVNPELQHLSNEKVDVGTLVQLFRSVYDNRVATKDRTPAYYILIGWDKATGFGVERDSSITSMMATLLQLCGEYNMHFIFINTICGQIPMTVQDACYYKVCGKVEEMVSSNLMGSRIASKVDENFKNGYMYINRGGEIKRAKIYKYDITRKISKTEFVM